MQMTLVGPAVNASYALRTPQQTPALSPIAHGLARSAEVVQLNLIRVVLSQSHLVLLRDAFWKVRHVLFSA